jgi:hypothetical protein
MVEILSIIYLFIYLFIGDKAMCLQHVIYHSKGRKQTDYIWQQCEVENVSKELRSNWEDTEGKCLIKTSIFFNSIEIVVPIISKDLWWSWHI